MTIRHDIDAPAGGATTLTVIETKPIDSTVIGAAPIKDGDKPTDRPIPRFFKVASAHPVVLLAASITTAAVLGATGGAFGALELMRLSEAADAAPAPTMVDETRPLQDAIVRLQADLAALKGTVEAGATSANSQFTKIAERLDRLDRAQTDARKSEATGSVSSQTVAAPPPPALRTPVLHGWTVRDVFRGTALIQSRRIGMLEVSPGDVIPGIGRIESIRQDNGRWVVVTSRGLITSTR